MSDPYIGEIRMFAGNFPPLGWALCNGQTVPIAQNPALFTLLGVTYGGDGQTNFCLPDLRGRMPMHWGQGAGLSNRTQGEAVGSATATVSTAQMPAHTHALQASGTVSGSNPGPPLLPGTGAKIYRGPTNLVPMAAPTMPNGGGQPHENRQPYAGVTFIIALQGIYPQFP